MHHEVCGVELLHLHSSFSILDGFGEISEYCNRAKTINQQYLCVTDHGSQGGVPIQIRECEKHGLNPIFGCELYLNPLQPKISNEQERKQFFDSLNDDEKVALRKNYHLLAIAFSEQGYKNLVRLSSWGHVYGWGGRPARPRVNYEMLEAHKEGIIFTSCCYASEIGQAFDRFGEDAAMDKVAEYIARFGENFRLEIMMLDFSKQKPYDRFILKAHDKFKVPILLTTDTHYCNKEDSHFQRLMLMVQTGRTLLEIEQLKQDPDANLFELQDTQLWMKSEDELNEFWVKEYSDVIDYELFKEAKRNTVRLCEKAKGVQLDRSNKLPQIEDDEEILKDFMIQGVKKRNLPKTKVYLDRLHEEYDMICRKGFASYFLILKQMADEARRVCPSILGYGDGSEALNVGRGSVAGSLVLYTLGITGVDPIHHDLLFSRFLSDARGGRSIRWKFDINPIPQDEDVT